MEPDGGTPNLRTEAIVDELRQLMALRSRSSVRDRACPELDRLLEPADLRSRDTRYVARANLLSDAIEHIHDQSHRTAAEALLGSGEGRWRTVAQRGSDAAAAFGCGWDAYRRRRTSGTSQLDDTLTALVEALVVANDRDVEPATTTTTKTTTNTAESPAAPPALDPTAETTPVTASRVSPVVIGKGSGALPDPEPEGRGAEEVAEVPSAAAGRRLPAYAVITAGVALLAAVVGFRYVTAADDDSSDTICSVLPGKVGDLPQGADEAMKVWSARFRAFARTLPAEAVECAGTMQRKHGLVIQPVAEPNPLGVGAIVAGDQSESKLVYLDYLEYWSYRTHLDRYGVEMLGIPLRRADRDGSNLVMLSRGALVGEAPPVSFVVMGVVWKEWMDRGGLDSDMGLPISAMRDSGGERIQDFENGRLVIDLVDPDQVRWEPVDNAAAALPTEIRQSVLQAEDGTSWFVDQDLVRHWMPTTNDYGCTTGLGTPQHTSVPAQAIVTLAVGEPLRCR